jgi:PAS domain-containing protein
VHPEDLPHVIRAFTQSIASGTPYAIVQRLRRSDGGYRWFQNNGFPLRDPGGHIVRWYVPLTDVDERKRAEDALRASERESRLIVDMIPGLVATLTPHGEVDVVNNRMVDYLGRPPEQVKPWETNDIVHPEDRARGIQIFGKVWPLETRTSMRCVSDASTASIVGFSFAGSADQNLSTSTIAVANASGASCGRLCPTPPSISRWAYAPENCLA